MPNKSRTGESILSENNILNTSPVSTGQESAIETEIAVNSTTTTKSAKSRVGKNILFHTLNVGSTFLLLSVGSILTARYLGNERMGQYGLLTTISTAMIGVGTLGLTDAASRFVAQYMAQGNRKLLLGFVRFGIMAELVVCILAALLLSGFATPFSQLFGMSGQESYFILLGLMVAPAMFGAMFTSILAGLQRYDLIAAVKIITSLPLLALTVVVLQFEMGITGLLVINIAVNFVALLLWIVLVMRLVPIFEPGQFTRPELWRTLKFSFSLLVLALFNMVVWQRSEVFFLGSFRSAKEVSLYIIPFVLSGVFATLVSNSMHALIPALAELISKGDLPGVVRLFHLSARVTAVIAVPVSFGGMLLAGDLLEVLYSSRYVEGTPVLQILFVATLAGTLAAGASYTIVSTSTNIWLFLGLMTGLGLLNIGLDLLIIPQYGIIGAALCNTIVQLLAPFAYDRLLQYLHGFGYPVKNLFGIIGVGLLSLLLAFAIKLGLGGVVGLVMAVLVFATIYLCGLLLFKVIYREDLEIFLKLVRRLPQRVQPLLNRWLDRASQRLKNEPPLDETKLKYHYLGFGATEP